MAEFGTDWYQLLTYRETRYVWYAQGQWVGHIMDWRGGNYHHGRVPNSPTFATAKEAVKWLRENFDSLPVEISGHHSGEYTCSKGCDDRTITGLDSVTQTTLGNGNAMKHAEAEDASR